MRAPTVAKPARGGSWVSSEGVWRGGPHAGAQAPRSAARRVPVSGCAASSRQPLEAASAESEGPFWPISRRERVCVFWGAGFFTSSPAPCCDTLLIPPGDDFSKSSMLTASCQRQTTVGRRALTHRPSLVLPDEPCRGQG